MPTTSELACSTATKTLARPSRMVIVCVMSVPHISLTLSVMIIPSCGLVSCVQRDAARAGRSRASPVAHDGRWCERQQSATAPITCGSPRREGGRRLCAGGYALPVPRPSMRRPDQGDRRSCCRRQAILAAALVTVGLRDPVADRLGRRFELLRQLLRRATGPHQLNHLPAEFPR